MAHKKGVGSTKNGRDSKPNMLGAKRADGQSVTAGSIPGGLTLNSNGSWSGTPNSVGSDATSTFTVRATAGSEVADREFTI